MKKTLNIFIHSLGIIILAIFIYFKIDLKKFLETFSQSNLLFLFPIFISAFFMFLFKALRWNLLNTMLGSKYPFWKSINVYLTGVLFSLSTPGKLGDFIKIYYLKKDLSLSYTSAFCSTFLDRIFDLLMLMLFSLTGIYIFSQNQIIVIGIFFLFFFILVYILIQKKILLNIVSFIFNRLIKKSAKDNMTLNNFLDSINKLVSIKQIFPFLFSIISYLFNFLTAFLILISLDMNISFFYLIPCVSFANLISILPFSISGIGIRDIILVNFFAVKGIANEKTLAFSLLYIILQNVPAMVLGLIYYLYNPIKLNKKDNK